MADTKSSIVLTDQEIIQYANLKETSLFHLAHMANIDKEGGEFVAALYRLRKVGEI